jgi:hypothetical protein
MTLRTASGQSAGSGGRSPAITLRLSVITCLMSWGHTLVLYAQVLYELTVVVAYKTCSSMMTHMMTCGHCCVILHTHTKHTRASACTHTHTHTPWYAYTRRTTKTA